MPPLSPHAERERESDSSVHGAVPRHRWHVLLILSLLMGFASISTDLYLPAIPTMARELGVPVGTIELTVSGYLVGFSLGQLLWGATSDRYGRRVPIALGLILFVVGSAGCASAHGAWGLISWRLIQAVGASASVVLARAMVRDLYAGHHAARMLSTLMTVMAIAPLLGPLAGGQILELSGWRAIFWLLTGIGVLTLAALWLLPETLPPENRHPEPLSKALGGYRDLLRDPRLRAYIGVGGFYYAGMFAYIAGSPYAYISYYHISPRLYGLLFGGGIIGVMAANLLNRRGAAHFGTDRILLWGAATAAVASVAAGVASASGWGGLAALAIPLLVYASMAGFIVANAIVGALADFPRRAGAVSALVGTFQYGFGVISSGILGAMGDSSPWPMGCIMLLSGLACLACAGWLIRRPGRVI
ncbi:multidrug effflux MFS transporter [Frateuria aurantia]